MPGSIENLPAKTIDEILKAKSDDEVKTIVSIVIETISKSSSPLQIRFVQDTMTRLIDYSPFDITVSQKWSNIKLARIMLNRVKGDMKNTADGQTSPEQKQMYNI
jgi:hypothetical protein